MPKLFLNLPNKWIDVYHMRISHCPRRFILLIILPWLLLAQPVLAQSYEAGRQAYLDKDYSKALEILQPLAEQGDSDAQVTLGLMYDYGHGVNRDQTTAIKWYTKAAEQGIPVVQHDLGVKYFQGNGVTQDYAKAADWWEQAANAGLADSQFNLGLIYYRGLGQKTDYDKAQQLFTRAADQNHANAQYSLAVMYAFGQGVDKDYDVARQWFEKSATQGIAQAQYNLGVFYENGYGVDPDISAAKRWYEKAAANDVDKARERLAELAGDDPSAKAATPTKPAAQSATAATTPVSTPAATDSNLRSNDWLKQQEPDSFTIQLISLTDEAGVAKYLRQQDLGPEAGYIAVIINGKTHYNAIYGHYDSQQAAEAGVSKLPAAIRANKPWIRNVRVLQNLLQP